uniref:Uncharacterized protein n=2 Tax=Caenorhabditis japonica TaxID=281687 RepID=A0A8R1EWH9_CAEJA
MKRVYWNPSMVRDSNLMCRTWTHFLDRCLLNLLLVPVSSQRALLHFLRTMNEIRSVLNDRPTVSICLSRVVSCEDFVIAAQNVIAKIVSDPIPVQQPGQATLEFALELW